MFPCFLILRASNNLPLWYAFSTTQHWSQPSISLHSAAIFHFSFVSCYLLFSLTCFLLLPSALPAIAFFLILFIYSVSNPPSFTHTLSPPMCKLPVAVCEGQLRDTLERGRGHRRRCVFTEVCVCVCVSWPLCSAAFVTSTHCRPTKCPLTETPACRCFCIYSCVQWWQHWASLCVCGCERGKKTHKYVNWESHRFLWLTANYYIFVQLLEKR